MDSTLIGTTYAALKAASSPDAKLLKSWQQAVQTVLQKEFTTSFCNLMDDSGLSDQPFFIEGDGFVLSLFANPLFDSNAQGLPLAFINHLEKHIKELTEGGRKLEFIFFKSHSKIFAASPYLSFLRQLAITHIKHVLLLPLTEYAYPEASTLMPFYNRKAPLFTFVFDAVFSQVQKDHLNKLFAFGDNASKGFDFDHLLQNSRSFMLLLVSNLQRTARLNESSLLDGMLQALLFSFHGGDELMRTEVNCVLSPELDQLYYPTTVPAGVTYPSTSPTVLALFQAISDDLLNANVESSRIALLIATFATTYQSLSPQQAQFALLALFHASLAGKIQITHRPQPLTPMIPFLSSTLINELFASLTKLASDLASLGINALAVPCCNAFVDIFDGSLLASLFAPSHNKLVAATLSGQEFTSIITIAKKYFKLPADAVKSTISLLESNIAPAPNVDIQTTAPLKIDVPACLTAESDSEVTSAAALAAIQWQDLPAINHQILKVLLSSLGDNGTVYSRFKDNQNLTKSTVIDAKPIEAPKAVEQAQDDLDDWDAEPEELDDWDAEEVEEVKPALTDAVTQEITDIPTDQSKPTHPSLLGGQLDLSNVSKPAPYWDTHLLVGDGSTMQAADKESLFIHNPVHVNRDIKNALRTLLYRYRDLSDWKNPYPMPPEDKIRNLADVSGPMLPFEKAKIWLTITAQNLTIKLNNSRITKANSTKKEYNNSMITPSRIVLRDIVATEQSLDIPSAMPMTKKEEEDKKKKQAGAKKGQPVKESVHEKVARETQEKQQKADMDKVNSIIATCRHLSLDKRINELDRKLIAHGDLHSALHGLMILLDWRLTQWKSQVEGKAGSVTSPTAATGSSAAAAAQVDAHMDVAVRLLQLLMDLSRRFLHLMTQEQMEKVQAAYAMLGFWDSEIEIELRWKNATGQARYTSAQIAEVLKKASSASKTTAERRYAVGASRSQFLMQHAGHILLRNVQSAKDHRVDGFYPDKWQRDLLDIVDANESALVVAPTSAGKTLVSFYTVAHVVRQNKEESNNGRNVNPDKKGVVVFVAPTFPLARQMEADICNRNKEATVVIHDTNQKLPNLKFDVLITIPSCLENLMTSPSRAEWVPRIRYIVFDEVHSIGSTLNGPTWERLFLLAHQTPFLALSATVGGVEHFRDWLIHMRAKYPVGESGLAKNNPIVADTALTTASQPSPRVHHISTSVRWSHLHHYFYIPQTSFFEEALEEIRANENNLTIAAVKPPAISDNFVSLHPVASLSLNNSSTSIGPNGEMINHGADADAIATMNGIDERALRGLFNVEFSSYDCLQLYQGISKIIAESPRFANITVDPQSPTATEENATKLKAILAELDRLNPDNYFGFFVEKIHIIEYERELKGLLMKMYFAVCDTELVSVIAQLSTQIQIILAPLSTATRARQQLWKQQFLPLLRSLQQRDWFPAIIFCLDRTLCTELLYHVVEQLEQDEHATWVKEKDKRLDKKAREKEYEAALKAAKRLRDNKGKGSAEATKELEEEIRMGLADASLLNPEALMNIKPYNPEDWNADAPDERFSFVKETEWMSEDVRAYWERRLVRKTFGKDKLDGQHPLIKALYRGFGVHHYGVDKQYRDLVEILFRQRNLKFVISIETLGLGVNMPCRTTVFAFTTVALNPLNYRQMSGRAGRRGFDDKGQVIFFGIDPYHACRLITSSLTPLRGHYNLSCATVLRLCLKFFFQQEPASHLAQIVNTPVTSPATGTKATVPVQISSNINIMDQAAFVTRSFFTFSEQFPQHIRIQLLHHFRYCFAYFQYLNLFNQNAPSGLAYFLSAVANATSSTGTASYVNDAGAFSLVYLLRNGHIDQLCSTFDTDPDGTAAKLMALITHLFYPLRMRNKTTKENYPASTFVPHHGLPAGHVILPSIAECVSPEIDTALKQHDAFVLQLFSRYALAVASTTSGIAQAPPGKLFPQTVEAVSPSSMMTYDDFVQLKSQTEQVITANMTLPLSTQQIQDSKQTADPLVQSYLDTAVTSAIRTPFQSLSTSKGDVFEDPYDLLVSLGKNVDLRASQLPINVDRYSPQPLCYSSYALDFYLNGEYDDVITVHGIHKAEAWAALMRFSKLLQVLKKCLSILSSSADEDNDDDFDEGNNNDADDDDDEEDTTSILRKSNLYANNQYVKDHLYIQSSTANSHRRTAKCFKHVFKTFFKHFAAISRDKTKV